MTAEELRQEKETRPLYECEREVLFLIQHVLRSAECAKVKELNPVQLRELRRLGFIIDVLPPSDDDPYTWKVSLPRRGGTTAVLPSPYD